MHYSSRPHLDQAANRDAVTETPAGRNGHAAPRLAKEDVRRELAQATQCVNIENFDVDETIATSARIANRDAVTDSPAGRNGHVMRRRDKDDVRRAVAGRWVDVLLSVAGIPAELLDGRGHPCPKCGGDDRFSLVDAAAGAVLCRHCFASANGDGFAAVGWMRGVGFVEAVALVADHVGYATPSLPAPSNGKRPTADEVLRDVCAAKRMPIASAQAYGARATRWGTHDVLEFPAYGPDGVECTRFAIFHRAAPNTLDAKGKNRKGSPAGVFLPHVDGAVRLPKLEETWHVVEGVKDAAALHSLEYLALGLPTSAMNPKFSPLLRGVHVVIVPDVDANGAGTAGASKTAATLAGLAASVRVATLPLAQGDVRDLLAGAIRDAVMPSPGASDASDAPPPPEPVRVITAAEFLSTDYRHEYIVDGILTAGEPMVVGGRAKSLKTSILIDLALSVGSGVPWLADSAGFATLKKTVAVISGESGAKTIQAAVKRIAATKGINAAEGATLWGFDLPCLGDDAGLESLEMMLSDHEVDVAIIDPVYLSLMGDATKGLNAGNLFDIGPLLKKIVEACLRHQTTPILIHHFRKNSGLERWEPPELEELSMSGFAEFARQWILLGRRAKYTSDGRHELWMSTGGSAGHGGLFAVDIDEGTLDDVAGRKWDVVVRDASDAQSEAKQRKADMRAREKADQADADQKAVLQALTSSVNQTATKSQIRDLAALAMPRINHAVASLLRAKHVEATTITKPNNREYDAIKLTDDGAKP